MEAFDFYNRYFVPFATATAVLLGLNLVDRFGCPLPNWLMLLAAVSSILLTVLWAWQGGRSGSLP
jgi:hypothetical protein